MRRIWARKEAIWYLRKVRFDGRKRGLLGNLSMIWSVRESSTVLTMNAD